jgi:hypothetical protein
MDLFVFRVNAAVRETELAEDIEAQGPKILEITRMSPAERSTYSDRVVLECLDSRKVLRSDFWPEGVCVRRFRQPRNRDEQHS